jgi:hypothetical protein
MEIKYTVHSCNQEDVTVKAMVAGREVDAKITGLVVELVSDCGQMGHTFRLQPADLTEAAKFFAVGEEIVLSFSKAD